MVSFSSIDEYFSLIDTNRPVIENQLNVFKLNMNKKSSEELKNEGSLLNENLISFNIQVKSIEFFYSKFLQQTDFKVKCFDEQSYLFLNEYLSETHFELVSFDQLPQNFHRRLYNKLATINKNIKKHCTDIQLLLNNKLSSKIQKYCDKICLNYINHKPDSVLSIQEMVSMKWYLKRIEDIGTKFQ